MNRLEELLWTIKEVIAMEVGEVNEDYPLAESFDPDFDKKHPFTTDGAGNCKCGRTKECPMHTDALCNDA